MIDRRGSQRQCRGREIPMGTTAVATPARLRDFRSARFCAIADHGNDRVGEIRFVRRLLSAATGNEDDDVHASPSSRPEVSGLS
jgi:hypothetical protein